MPRFILHPSTFILFLSLFAEAAPNDPPAANANSKFALTIYSTADAATFDPQDIAALRQANAAYKVPGYAVVGEMRKITLASGENTLKFSDIAAGIDPTTVSFKSLTAPNSTAVIEQNFEYDLVTPDKLLEKYLGKNIIVNRKQEPLPNDRTRMPETIEAKLLSYTADQLVLQTNNKQLPVQIIPRNSDITEIKLFDLKDGLSAKPTLVWKISAKQAGEHNALVSYQTDNITWRADYSLTLNSGQSAADLSCWATLVNYSGASYSDAKIKLVAGDVHRLQPRPRVQFARAAEASANVSEKPLFEYHLYTLSRPTTLANNAIKQVELFTPKNNIPFTKSYVYAGGEIPVPYGENPVTDRAPRNSENKNVDVFLTIANDEKSGLGIPLPAGRFRIYLRDKPDADETAPAAPQFIGEDKIDHTRKDQNISLRTGSAFDITAERKQSDFTLEGKLMTESFEIKIHNHKKEAVKVNVKETLYRWSQWQITAVSEKYEREDSRTIKFPLEVGPEQEKSITYTVKYTW
jgi:hypothetical protein